MLLFSEDRMIEQSALQPVPAAGIVWLDLVRRDSGWRDQLPPGLELPLHPRHEKDILNARHPPFFNKTHEYEFLIFRAYDQASHPSQPGTRAIAFALYGNVVVTIRDPDDQSFAGLPERWSSGEITVPSSVVSLLHRLLDEVVDRLMGMREPVNRLLAEWQDRLLDPHDPFDDWQQLMRLRNQLRGLSGIMDSQLNILEAWRDEHPEPFSENLEIRFNDLEDHMKRVANYAEQNQAAIDALVQIHFAANGQRTNQGMQFLAAISAIFLPLNLLAGFFGMNFADMPFLQLPWAGAVMALIMAATMVVLVWWFRIRRWL